MSNQLIRMLPKYSRKSVIYVEIMDAENEQFKTIETNIEDIYNQFFVDSATWSLTVYEKEYGIKTIAHKPYDERRAVIKSKIRGRGTVTAALIKNVVDAFTNGDVNVSFANSNIHIDFISVYGIPPNLQDALKAVDDIKPAHLGLTYALRYMNWDELDSYNLTWDDLDALNLTWDELEVYNNQP